MERAGFRIPLVTSILVVLVGIFLLLTVDHASPLYWVAVVLAVFGISNGIHNIGLQNLLYTFIDKAESGVASGLLMTSRFIGNILASSIYGVAFATGMSDSNMGTMTIVLLVVALLLLPGMLFVTRHEKG
ncbi:MFS transporter [Lentibacillus salicampi]|uniref:Major facilitator superfamily (MFS) profile domain-containing protein n=1 Tax=Lentibacillus salicampi TaxID=175306 RepID=A0A4Y9A9W4_9BACI|nr:MFS transporter [Lentibacillus salicampi]TFJ91670.1 hypothetical protein E4U82_16480 [Lentibacillus salicampi]